MLGPPACLRSQAYDPLGAAPTKRGVSTHGPHGSTHARPTWRMSAGLTSSQLSVQCSWRSERVSGRGGCRGQETQCKTMGWIRGMQRQAHRQVRPPTPVYSRRAGTPVPQPTQPCQRMGFDSRLTTWSAGGTSVSAGMALCHIYQGQRIPAHVLNQSARGLAMAHVLGGMQAARQPMPSLLMRVAVTRSLALA